MAYVINSYLNSQIFHQIWDQYFDVHTCGIDHAIGANGPVRGPDVPLAISRGFECGHRSWVVDLGSVHASASGQSHCQRVRVDVSVSWRVQPCQHLKDNRRFQNNMFFFFTKPLIIVPKKEKKRKGNLKPKTSTVGLKKQCHSGRLEQDPHIRHSRWFPTDLLRYYHLQIICHIPYSKLSRFWWLIKYWCWLC